MATRMLSTDHAAGRCRAALSRHAMREAVTRATRALWRGLIDGPLGSLVSLALAIVLSALMLHAIQGRDAARQPDAGQVNVRRGTVVVSASPSEHAVGGAASSPLGAAGASPLIVALVNPAHQAVDRPLVLTELRAEMGSGSPSLNVVIRTASTANQEADAMEWIAALRTNLGQAVTVIDLR